MQRRGGGGWGAQSVFPCSPKNFPCVPFSLKKTQQTQPLFPPVPSRIFHLFPCSQYFFGHVPLFPKTPGVGGGGGGGGAWLIYVQNASVKLCARYQMDRSFCYSSLLWGKTASSMAGNLKL